MARLIYTAHNVSEEVKKFIKFESLDANRIKVVSKLPKKLPEPLHSIREQMLEAEADSKFGLVASNSRDLGINVSLEKVDRAFKIIFALTEAFNQRNIIYQHNDNIRDHYQSVLVNGEYIRFVLKERTSWKVYKKDNSTLQGMLNSIRLRFVRDGDMALFPNGKFSFEIIGPIYRCRNVWNETPRLPIEKQLNSFISGLFIAAFAKKSLREEREAYQTEVRLKREVDQIHEQKAYEKAARAECVVSLVKNFEVYTGVIKLLKIVKRKIRTQGDLEELNKLFEIKRYLEEFIDSQDPIKNFENASPVGRRISINLKCKNLDLI